MDNPGDARTVINVKGVSVEAWDRARKAARQRGQTMGEWASRAFDKLADMETGDQVELPVKQTAKTDPENSYSGKALDMEPADLADLMRGVAALATASSTPPTKADTRRAYGLADDMVRQARGLPPRPVRVHLPGKATGQSLLASRKAEPDA